MNYGLIFTIISVIFSAGAIYGTWRVSVNHIHQLREDIIKIFARLDNIDKQISTIQEWERLMEKRITENNTR